MSNLAVATGSSQQNQSASMDTDISRRLHLGQVAVERMSNQNDKHFDVRGEDVYTAVDKPKLATLDFDARVPVPFSVFPSAYKNEQKSSETTEVKTEERVTVQDAGREGRSEHITQQGPSRRDDRFTREDIRITEHDRFRPGVERVKREEHVNVYDTDRREQYREPYQRYSDAQIDVQDRVYDREHPTRHTPATQIDVDTRIDVAERDYRTRTVPFTEDFRETRGWEEKSTRPREYPQQGLSEREPVTFDEKVTVREERTVDPPRSSERKHRLDMGYYDNEGQYHSFRHGLHKAADRVLYGKEHHHHHHEHAPRVEEDIVIEDREITMSAPRYSQERRYTERSASASTITIPCHHIRIGDLLILQGRPCQVIRITTSAQTGQHRYLGVDLFTKQLHEESSFVSNPSPSVVVQNMVGPVFKQYRVLDIREDGKVVAMTETGDVKQGLPVLDQSSLLQRLSDSFENGRGSVRVLVINDEGRELAVDYKVVHGSREVDVWRRSIVSPCGICLASASGILQLARARRSCDVHGLWNGRIEYRKFEAFDEPWKIIFDTDLDQWESHWGLLDVDRKLKEGLVIPDCEGKTVDRAY
nr:woronin body major protein [Quercus suber]